MPKKPYNIILWLVILVPLILIVLYYFNIGSFTRNELKPASNSSLSNSNIIVNPYDDMDRTEILNEIRHQYTFDQYQNEIKNKRVALTEEFNNTDLVERIVLERELSLLDVKSGDPARHYELRVSLLLDTWFIIKTFKGELSADEYVETQEALINGNTEPADKLLSRIEDIYISQSEQRFYVLAAIAVFQRGKIANEQQDKRKAYRYFRRAAQYNPNKVDYLIEAGIVSGNIALFNNAILYFEHALHFPKNSTAVTNTKYTTSKIWSYLGDAWLNKGEPDKAINYFNLALTRSAEQKGAGNLQTAIYKKGLGEAWEIKGESRKAIQYYSESLKTIKHYQGEDDPESLFLRERIESLVNE